MQRLLPNRSKQRSEAQMNSLNRVAVVILMATSAAIAQTGSTAPVSVAPAQGTPAQLAVQRAEAMLNKNPGRAEELTRLALAHLRRFRETGDPNCVALADATVKQALQATPGDFSASKAAVAVLLARQEYNAALVAARMLQKHMPDDITVHGYVMEAEAVLGNYDDAEKAANWMFRLRPGNLPAMIHGAALRETFGLLPGAEDLLTTALRGTPLAETEERAWLLTQLARINRTEGKLPEATQFAESALTSFPNYHLALEELARIRMQQGQPQQAVTLLRQLQQQVPTPGHLYQLAVALKAAGQAAESKQTFESFEAQARTVSGNGLNYNRELIWYYADVAGRPQEALALAERAMAARHDVATLDAYAWTLFRNGRTEEARKFADQALRVGTKDPAVLAHASQIGVPAGDGAAQAATAVTAGQR